MQYWATYAARRFDVAATLTWWINDKRGQLFKNVYFDGDDEPCAECVGMPTQGQFGLLGLSGLLMSAPVSQRDDSSL